jgi:hypothetical protein
MTTKEEIETVHGSGGHVVLLGAGASLAATLRNPEKNGKKLPLMNNIVEIVGLEDVINSLPNEIKEHKANFETLYSLLHELTGFDDERTLIEERVYKYFESMDLPDTPTIYDYLILSLRAHKDVIATFNWDPFLYKAYLRNYNFTLPPGVLFLHNNVAIGFDEENGHSGPAGWTSKETLKDFKPTKLLFPVAKKDYNSDPFLIGQWDSLQKSLKKAEKFTVFGYSAPKSDVEAIELLQKGWGDVNNRSMEQFEFIDIQEENSLVTSWNSFVHSSHYDYCNDYFDSSLAYHPRRTIESHHYVTQPMTINHMFLDGNQVPDNFRTLEEMWEWHRPLIEAEKKFYNS